MIRYRHKIKIADSKKSKSGANNMKVLKWLTYQRFTLLVQINKLRRTQNRCQFHLLSKILKKILFKCRVFANITQKQCSETLFGNDVHNFVRKHCWPWSALKFILLCCMMGKQVICAAFKWEKWHSQQSKAECFADLIWNIY